MSDITASAGLPPIRLPNPIALRPAYPIGRAASLAVRATALRGSSVMTPVSLTPGCRRRSPRFRARRRCTRHADRMNPLRLLVGVLVRTVAFLVVIAVVVLAIDTSDSTDALGAGLLAFLVLVTIAFAWALVDGVRRGFVPSLLLWALTSAV